MNEKNDLIKKLPFDVKLANFNTENSQILIKNVTMMKTLKPITLIFMVLLLIVGACENLTELETTDSSGLKSEKTESDERARYKLTAGQYMYAGYVYVSVDGDDLVVEYYPFSNCWCITEIHLHVALSLEDIPQKNGNPIPGKFDIKEEFRECKEWMDEDLKFTYSLSEEEWEEGDLLYIAAHAVVKNTCEGGEETAWAGCCKGCLPFPGRNWATYVEFTIPTIP
jgi:hypothetical protein